MSLNMFNCSENSLCKKFRGFVDSQGFIKVWMELIHPQLNKRDGTFNDESLQNPADESIESDNDASTFDQRKRKTQTDTPPSMIPASKVAKRDSRTDREITSDTIVDSEMSMDDEYRKIS